MYQNLKVLLRFKNSFLKELVLLIKNITLKYIFIKYKI